MNLSRRVLAPVFCIALVAIGGAASATPVTADPFVTIGAGSSPQAVAVAFSGEFFVANLGSDSITAYTAGGVLETGRSMSMPAGSNPIDVKVEHGTTAVWSANVDTHSIARFVPGATVPTIFDLGAAIKPDALAITPTDVVYSANSSSDTVSQVKLVGATYQSTAVYARLPAGSAPVGIVSDPDGVIYTANSGNGTVSRITPAKTEQVAQLPTGAPFAIAIDHRGKLWVANSAADTVVQIDPAKASGSNIVSSVRLLPGSVPSRLTVDGADNVYVTSRGANSVSVIPAGASTAVTIQTMPAGSGVFGIAVSPQNVLLTTSFARGVVSSIDLATAVTLQAPVTGAQVGSRVTGTVTATGIDPITFSSTTLPAWLTLDPKTGVFTGMPPTPGSVSFTVVATSLVSKSEPFTVSFAVGGVAPTASPTPPSTVTAIPTATATAGAGGQSAGTGAHSTGVLASTGASDGSRWGIAGAIAFILGVVGACAARVHRRQHA
ncbi:virginiamycin B lyase family protein [Subtercola boreus]|uniref:Uncharacterized protein n=1 Tax=Subtercola boreus TaxID=120213 RepID=A0A3E0WFF4_9MICO|nr:putative Ig domain-containing protein [Subtercola boreus]RFA23526.1 hypothetical protein B7R24_01165 [Subtercola boreus]RFA23920.1 hypothetical protein B7R23_01165 [Subtercola boreus]RFA29619.1 hypothetical protein B7R25_01160 [Subtercola boreus]